MSSIKKILAKKNGFTLIEIITSLGILGILAVTFLSIITGSFYNIVKAGKETESLFESQSKMEISIVDEEVFDKAEIPIEIRKTGMDPWVKLETIKGGLAEEDSLQTFIPFVPAISIEPKRVNEGYNTTQITIVGVNTHFTSGSSIKITNDKGYDNSPSKSIINNTKATFNLPTGTTNRLKNSGDEYIITIKTGEEIAKAKLKVDLPRFISTEGTKAEASDDIKNRVSLLENIGEIRRVLWEGKRYFLLGKNKTNNKGIIYVLENGKELIGKTISDSAALNSLAYNEEKFIVIGDNGTILKSNDGNNWSRITGTNNPVEVLGNNLNSVSWGPIMDNDGNINNTFIIAGDNGIILKSENGDKWELATNLPAEILVNKLISVAWGKVEKTIGEDYVTINMFIAVDDKGNFIKSENGSDWEQISIPANPNKKMNSIIWDGDSFISVGEAGTILSSQDGDTWLKHDSKTNKDLYDICQSFNGDIKEFYIVGDKIMLTSEYGVVWTPVTIDKQIISIAARE